MNRRKTTTEEASIITYKNKIHNLKRLFFFGGSWGGIVATENRERRSTRRL
jgi:hypothetical protein